MIRLAAIEDAEAIASVHVRTWQVAYEGIVPPEYLASLSILERANMWRRVVSEKRNTVLVASTSSGEVGFISFGPSREKDVKEKAEVYAIYVLAQFWNQGIGGELLEEAEQRLADFAAVRLWVLEKNAIGRRFYEARGFSYDGTRKEEAIGGSLLTELRYEKRLGRREIL
ncbi:MAG TPA: GNAT family N-acetyltransferase [Chthoniobacterales bacterium]